MQSDQTQASADFQTDAGAVSGFLQKPMPKVLVVDDEPELRSLLSEYLVRYGFIVRTAADAREARLLVAQDLPRVVVLDLNMPGESGLSLAAWLRQTHPGMAIVMLTAQNDVVDRAIGLELAADDYIGKPFDLRELLARLRAVLRRTDAGPPPAPGPAQPGVAADPEQVSLGDRVLHLGQRKLLGADGAEVALTAAEFDLLWLFVRHPNRPLSRDQIMEQAHHRAWDVFDRSIDLRVMRLRRKIERNADKPELLKTVRGVGYVYVPAPDRPALA